MPEHGSKRLLKPFVPTITEESNQQPMKNDMSTSSSPPVMMMMMATMMRKNGTTNEQRAAPQRVDETLPRHHHQVHPMFQEEYDKIDAEDPVIKCARYGFKYNSTTNSNNSTMTMTPNKKNKRRIFFGALVADDNYEVVRAHATEAHGLYHLVSLTECNSTFAGTAREMRFAPGTEGFDLVHSGIFGPSTSVHVNVYLGDAMGSTHMNREFIQRDTIIDAWVKGGMTVDDIGLVADMDEMFSRDFLVAAQICDIPAFEPGNNCHMPKVMANAMHYESTPECTQTTRWYHPDMVSGQCISGIGNPVSRIVPERTNGTQGMRLRGHGQTSIHDYIEAHRVLGRYPLHTATDFRMAITASIHAWWIDHPRPGPDDAYVTAFHLHNFFDDLTVLRHKYKTYGHAHPYAGNLTFNLASLFPEWDLVTRCVKGLPNEVKVDKASGLDRHLQGFTELKGNKPIFFMNETYRRERHKLVSAMIMEEEEIHGDFYKKDVAKATAGNQTSLL